MTAAEDTAQTILRDQPDVADVITAPLQARLDAVRECCDDWDAITKGPTGTTIRIRRAMGDVT